MPYEMMNRIKYMKVMVILNQKSLCVMVTGRRIERISINKVQSSCFSALMIASIFFAVRSFMRNLTSGPLLIIFESSIKQTQNSWLSLMFLHFERFSLTTWSLTDSMNRPRRISCASLITFSSYSKIYQNPHCLRTLTKGSSLRLALPKSTTSIFLFLMPEDMKMFHMRCANFQDSFPLQLYRMRMSFLMVTTACFWKLWLKLFLVSLELFEGELEEIGYSMCRDSSRICWREMKVFSSSLICACFSFTYSYYQKNKRPSSSILEQLRKLVFGGIIFLLLYQVKLPCIQKVRAHIGNPD